jgi:serine/threonine-protein kinase
MSPEGRVIREAGAPVTSSVNGAARLFTDTDDHDLVQRRLGITYGIFSLIILGFWVLVAVFIAIGMPSRFWELQLSASKLVHLAGVLVLGGAWFLCRGPARSRSVLAAIDLGGSLILTTVAAVVIALSPQGIRAEVLGSVIFVLVVSVRAALVPSPPRWTVLVSAIAAIPTPIGAYACALRDAFWNDALMPRTAVLMISFGWAFAGILASYVTSRVVYGLRAEVKSAMRLGQYTLEEKIGEGGMGSVHRARHALLQRPTAIKLLSPDRAGAANVKRFEREVQLTSKLTHPNTIAIYDFGHTHEGVFYYAMELIDGVSLQELGEEEGALPPGRVVFILAQAASALAEAHDIGLIHRDVKPANILLTLRGGLPDFVKVLDFGLVKETTGGDAALSTANAIAGTPLYMAPESITRPEAVDARVDLYALGGVAYWLLTGAPVFEGANLVEICSHHLHTKPTPPSERAPGIPPELDALVLRCLAKKADDRPSSARALMLELRALQDECPWSEDEALRWWTARTARTEVRTNESPARKARANGQREHMTKSSP